MGKFLKGKGASLAENKKNVPNGHMTDSSLPLGDKNSQEVISETNGTVGKRSSFGGFLA